MKKLLIVAAGVTGYVLGARAGRARYEQIKDGATKVWSSDPVQRGVDEATVQAKHAASAAGSKAADAASAAAAKVAETVRHEDHVTEHPAAERPDPLLGDVPAEGPR